MWTLEVVNACLLGIWRERIRFAGRLWLSMGVHSDTRAATASL